MSLRDAAQELKELGPWRTLYRVGWELIDFSRYHYWGKKRAVVMQFSRGCPHLCSYCGQRGFWTRWRHRDPKKFAQEIARLHREHGVQIVNLADENPTSQRKAWKEFCEALIAENVDVELVGSTRAGDIVIAEVKLWRNPEARRKVVAQALDYASCIFQMSYSEFEQAALAGILGDRPKPRSLYEFVSGQKSHAEEPLEDPLEDPEMSPADDAAGDSPTAPK